MLMLLRALHPIAAQRGDGLRPELARLLSGAPSAGSPQREADLPNGENEPDIRDAQPEHASGPAPLPTTR